MGMYLDDLDPVVRTVMVHSRGRHHLHDHRSAALSEPLPQSWTCLYSWIERELESPVREICFFVEFRWSRTLLVSVVVSGYGRRAGPVAIAFFSVRTSAHARGIFSCDGQQENLDCRRVLRGHAEHKYMCMMVVSRSGRLSLTRCLLVLLPSPSSQVQPN